ncbi:GDYXXLXY domain-containing protein [Gloeocapsopsis dulcis]|uniref:Membrane-anchored protein n=1 Tax=Gloeocapsopsis dulcis AAB1 = 1H9 TaxID=1433147 RepID=A0A6N8FQL6_9CHRO|nr:GDYXXLXY domain-containing protein [Gloeocapsopsis dulcis]MUL35480.1 membrane-anchored protein [Gloeocapsopsis dulcis AAB1 = 1H9]WNN90326.1 GDYXXLXY domain-containing protein [Gloeocapsopsis dulcis]
MTSKVKTTPEVVKPQQLPRKLPFWRLWLPLLFQAGIIVAAPAQPFYTQLTGKTAILQTVPVDPYDPLRGYSQILSYDISQINNLQQLPGWQELIQHTSEPAVNGIPTGTNLYVTLEAPTSNTTPPPAWKPVRVSRDRPQIATNQVAIKGKLTGNSVTYGLETYYMPEAQRDEINQSIVQAQRDQQQRSLVVEVKVDTQGRAVPISFWVNQRNYRF